MGCSSSRHGEVVPPATRKHVRPRSGKTHAKDATGGAEDLTCEGSSHDYNTHTVVTRRGTPSTLAPRSGGSSRTGTELVAIDQMLSPMVQDIERKIGNRWTAMDCSVLEKVVGKIVSQAESSPHGNVSSVANMYSGLENEEDVGVTNADRSEPFTQLWLMMGAIFCHKITHESTNYYKKLWNTACKISGSVGLPFPGSSRLLSSSAKAVALYLLTGANYAECKAKLRISRDSPFSDSLTQLLPAAPTMHRTKLFPTFVDGNDLAESGEGHGPRKEYFERLGADFTGLSSLPPSSTAKLFEYVRGSETFWVNRKVSSTNASHYYFAGWLIAQSLQNKAPLGLRLAIPLTRALLNVDAPGSSCASSTPAATVLSLADVRAIDPDTAAGIDRAVALFQKSKKEFGELAELSGYSSTISLEDYLAAVCEEALLPQDVACTGINNIPATRNASTNESTNGTAGLRKGALEPLCSGFYQGLGPTGYAALKQLHVTASDLQDMIAGGSARDGAGKGTGVEHKGPLLELFRVAVCDELEEKEEYWSLVQEVIENLTSDQKRKFLAFVTGSDRWPLKGAEALQFEMPFVALGRDEWGIQLGMLPQSHTCSNTLEIPDYWEAYMQVHPTYDADELTEKVRGILVDRITLAMECHTYDLDE